MTKNKKSKIYASIFVLIFVCIGFACLSINKVFAAELEVVYPTINGQTLSTSTELPAYVKYMFDAGMFIGFFSVFISLIIGGVMYLMSAVSIEMKSSARDRISGAISGLLILSLTYLIITTINPQLSILNLNKLPDVPTPTIDKTNPGVSFYKNSNCSDSSVQPSTASVPDLGVLKNKLKSVGIVKGTDAYISVIYDTINFRGRCQYLDPNLSCQPGAAWASSASVNAYDFSTNGDGVYFYRRSYFNDAGGFYKVKNSDIKTAGIYIKKLESMKFTGVPENEQDCTKYDTNGACISRTTPSLSGENISSVKIDGNYLVLFVYFDPSYDQPSGPWSFCQAFPTVDDVNKMGPQQIKWENIRNLNSMLPNYVVIIPVKQK